MCGRLNLSDLDGIRQMMADIGLPLFDVDKHEPCYNIAPTSLLPALLAGANGAPPLWQHMHWGMPLERGPLVINARSETAAEKPTFKHLLQQRALVLVNGFYEWQKRNGERHAWHFQADEEPALALAALWRNTEQGPQLALLTTEADEHMAPVHHRMPIAVGSTLAQAWLQGHQPLLPPMMALRKRRVGHWVDNAKHQGPHCLDEPEQQPFTPDLFD